MTLARLFTPSLALVLAFPGLALADEEAKKRGDALVKGLKYDGGLYGTYWLGVHYGPSKNVGHMKLVVESSPPGGQGYWVKTDVTFVFGPMSQVLQDRVHLNTPLANLGMRGKLTETNKGVSVTTTKRIEHDTKMFKRSLTRGGKAKTQTIDFGPDYWEVAQRLLLARKLPLETPTTYELRGVKWPSWTAEPGTKPEWRTITITVPKAADYDHRGKTVKAHKIAFAMEKDADEILVVDTKHNLLALLPAEEGVRLIAATSEKQAKADLPKAPDTPEVKAIKAAVIVYFEVVFRVKQPEALDAVLDWEALKTSMAKAQPSLNDQATAEFAASIKKELGSAKVDPEGRAILGLLDALLKVEIKGKSATVKVNDSTFGLEQGEDKQWKLVRVPVGS